MFFKKKKKLLTLEEFVEKLREKLPVSITGLEVIAGVKSLLLIEYKNNRHTFNYEKEYEKYAENPDSIDEIYANIKSDILSRLEPIKVDAAKILPRIKNRQYFKEHIEDNSDMANVIYHRFTEELFVFFVEERDGKFYPLQKSDLIDLNFSIEELHQKTANNLANLPNLGARDDNGLHSIVAGGVYESSFILLNLFLRNNFSVPGYIVAALPAHDTFFITGSEDKKNLSRLREIINKIKNDGYPIISENMFLLNDFNNFVVFEPDFKE